jgi:hypothetical protein
MIKGLIIRKTTDRDEEEAIMTRSNGLIRNTLLVGGMLVVPCSAQRPAPRDRALCLRALNGATARIEEELSP